MVVGWQRSTELQLKNQRKWTYDKLMECPDSWNSLEESWAEWQALTSVTDDLVELVDLCEKQIWSTLVSSRVVDTSLTRVGEDVRFVGGMTCLLRISEYRHLSFSSLLYHSLLFHCLLFSRSLGILLWLQLHKASLCFALFQISCSFAFFILTS